MKDGTILLLQPMYKFLVIQTAFIGDVVLATSMVEQLHQQYPQARIDFLLRKGNEALLQGHPYINTVLVWDKKKNKNTNLLRMALRVRREQYTHVFNAQRFASSGLVTVLSGAGYTAGFDKNPFSFAFTRKVPHVIAPDYSPTYQHETQRYQLLLDEVAKGQTVSPRLYPSSADMAMVQQYKCKPFITMSPASVWYTKTFPVAQWSELLDRLHDYKVYMLGGPADAKVAEAVKNGSSHPDTEILCGRLNYLQSAGLMQDAVMNYTNDSAPLHFASAMHAPVTAVFCSTIPSFGFGPVHDNGRIVEIDHRLNCRPCGLHGHKACPQGHFKCAKEIKTDQLLWWTLKTT